MDEALLKLAEIGRAAVDFRRAELNALSTPTTLLQRLGSAELSKLRSERNRLIREYIERLHPPPPSHLQLESCVVSRHG